MYKKIVLTLFVVLAILFGCASAQDEVADSITLDIYPSSSIWWIAVDPLGDGNATVSVDLQESGDATWHNMTANPSWGFYALTATGGNGFNLPLSIRLTSASAEQLVFTNVITSIAGGMIDTDEQFSDESNGHHTNQPTQTATQAPTKKPKHTQAPTPAPTKKPSHTQAPTEAPTKKPATPAPTQKPATPAPTKKPSTPAPTQKPSTPAPTKKPTQAPATQAPTKKPTSSSSSSGSSSGSSTDLCTPNPTSSEPIKIMVPLYEDPDTNWQTILTAAATGVPILAIINPDNGPVSSGPDSAYTSYMAQFAAAGIEMYGYVHTLYGARSLSTVEADVATYASKYKGLSGIFVDEASADASELSYYTSLFASIQASGFANTVLNPGTVPDQGYQSASTNIMIFENLGSAWNSKSMPSWGCAPSASAKAGYKYKFSAVAYGTSQTDMPTLVNDFANAGIGYVFAAETSNTCCVYNTLTPYFADLASTVKGLN